MALGTAHSQTQKHGAKRIRPVDRIHEEIFVLDGAALVAGDMIAIETTGNHLFLGWIVDQITGQLVDDELIEGLIGSIRLENPVPPWPDRTAGIHVDPRSIAVS